MRRLLLAVFIVGALVSCAPQQPIIVTIPATSHLDANGATVEDPQSVIVIMPPQQVVVPYYTYPDLYSYPYQPPFVYPQPFLYRQWYPYRRW